MNASPNIVTRLESRCALALMAPLGNCAAVAAKYVPLQRICKLLAGRLLRFALISARLRYPAGIGSHEALRRRPANGHSPGGEWDTPFMMVTNIVEDGQPIGAFGDGEMWFHHDTSYYPEPNRATLLYSLKITSRGGQTCFSNMYKAYENIPRHAARQARRPEDAAGARLQAARAHRSREGRCKRAPAPRSSRSSSPIRRPARRRFTSVD